MKKLLILLLALVMCLSVLTSCDQIKGFIDGIIGGEEPPVTSTQADSAITLIKDDLKDWKVTAADYQLNAYTHQGEVKVEWSVNVDASYVSITHDYENGVVYVDVNEESTTDVAYVLTAKVTDSEGNVRETSFNLTLPKDKLTTYDELVAAENDATLKVQGIVVGIIKKSDGWGANSLYIQDAENKGGYYAYNLADEEIAGVEVGMTVKVTGTKDTYNGIYEVMNGKVDIVDTTIKAVTPVDYTEVFTNAADTKAEDLIYRQSMLVTVKGVELSTQKEDQGYLNFKLAGKEAYVRISSSNNCITKAEADALKALHASNFGNTADVTGIIQLYNGAFYLIPATGVDAISNIKEVEKTPAEKVAAEKDNLAIDASYSADGDYTLPVAGTNYADVVIAWASNSEYVVVGANGVITVKVPDTKTEVVLTATLTCGEATATKEITITLNKSITSIADANAIGAAQGSDYTAEKYLVAGVVTEVANATYGNIYISNGTDKFYIYGLYDAEGNRYDAMTNAPAVGDYVVVLTSLGQYKGAPQGKNATLVTHVVPTTIVEANTIGAAQGSDYTTEKYLVTGVVDEVANATYGNIYIKDADGTRFYIYGLYDQAGNRYDKMATAPKVGDTITVLTTLGQYKGAPQGKNATLVAHTVASTDTPVEHVCESVCATCQKCTDAACTEAACADKCQGHETVSHPEGVVDPVVGTPYAFGMVQKNKDNTTYYLKGGMDGYYMATTDVHADALHVYIEETTGGYYLYCMVDGVKTYINCVVSDTHVNGKYETTASTVYRYDATSKTLIAVVNDTEYWFGTRNDKTYTTVGPCAVSYAGFYCQFYNIDTTPHEHTYTDVTVAATCTTNGSVTPTCACGVVDEENVQVLPMAHTLDENKLCSVCDKYVLESSSLVAVPDKNTMTDGQLIELGYFTIICSKNYRADASEKEFADGYASAQRLNLGGKAALNKNSVKFTTDGAATITVWWVHGGKGPEETGSSIAYRNLVIYDADKNIVAQTNGQYGKYEVRIDTFEISAAGTYYLGGLEDNNYIYKVEVTPVKEVVAGEQTTAKVVIADYADANSWENSKQYTTLNIDENVTATVSGTASGNYGVNTGKYYENGENWRIYWAEKATLTFTAAEGKTIVSVKITYVSEKTGVLTLAEENIASDTVVSVNANTVTFVVGDTNTADNGQVRITAIEVVYE